jgi:hypothetical protein
VPIHGGFAYAIQIRQQVFNNSVLLAYHAGTIKRRLFLPDLPDGPPIVGMDFYLDPPAISFDPANHNQLILTITGRGGLTVEFQPAGCPGFAPLFWALTGDPSQPFESSFRVAVSLGSVG